MPTRRQTAGQIVYKLKRKINLLASLNEVHKTRGWLKNRRIFNPFQKSHGRERNYRKTIYL